MLRKALIAASLGLGVQFTVSDVLPFVRTLAKYPHTRFDVLNFLILQAVILVPTGALILFFVALLREGSALNSIRVRQVTAFLAAFGQALGLSQSLWVAWHFLPFDPARYWAWITALQVVPSLLWVALLLIFWKEPAPINNRWTRPLALALCVGMCAVGLRGIYNTVARLSHHVGAGVQRFTAAPAGISVYPALWDRWGLANWAVYALGYGSLAFLLFAIYRARGERADALSSPSESFQRGR